MNGVLWIVRRNEGILSYTLSYDRNAVLSTRWMKGELLHLHHLLSSIWSHEPSLLPTIR
jgi:hypothetical protein